MGFDKSFYESAKIDGATRWQQIKYITLPLLRPTIIMLTMMAIGRIFYSDFGLFYQVPMNQGALYSTTNTIDTYVYRGPVSYTHLDVYKRQIQKRTTTFVSLQPFFSKWWCNGAMRKMRFFVFL